MPRQLDLFEPRANYRKGDPETSRLAAEGVEKTGRAATYRALVLRAIQSRPGRTCGEVAETVGIPRQELSKRFKELEEAGAIRRGEKRQCDVQGTQQLTWWAVADFPPPSRTPLPEEIPPAEEVW